MYCILRIAVLTLISNKILYNIFYKEYEEIQCKKDSLLTGAHSLLGLF